MHVFHILKAEKLDKNVFISIDKKYYILFLRNAGTYILKNMKYSFKTLTWKEKVYNFKYIPLLILH